MRLIIIALLVACAALSQGVQPGGQIPAPAPNCTDTRTTNCTPKTDASGALSIDGLWDASGATHTLVAKKGLATSKPATCTVGEEYFATDATAGQNKYYCTATNTWTQQTGGGGSSANATMTIDLPAGGMTSGILTGPWNLGGSSGGGNAYYHGIDLSNSGTPSYKAVFRLPANFDKTQTVSIVVTGGNYNSGLGGAVGLNIQMACFGAGQATYSDPTYGTAASVSITQTADSKMVEGTAASLPLVAACDSKVMASVLVSRDNTVGSNLADIFTVYDVALSYGTK